jgi:hypothetical protein
MSVTSLGFLATLISALCLTLLAASDPKRSPGRRAALSGLRRLTIALAILPGVVLAITGDWVGFLIWLGAVAVLGWAIAAAFSAFFPPKNSRVDQP